MGEVAIPISVIFGPVLLEQVLDSGLSLGSNSDVEIGLHGVDNRSRSNLVVLSCISSVGENLVDHGSLIGFSLFRVRSLFFLFLLELFGTSPDGSACSPKAISEASLIVSVANTISFSVSHAVLINGLNQKCLLIFGWGNVELVGKSVYQFAVSNLTIVVLVGLSHQVRGDLGPVTGGLVSLSVHVGLVLSHGSISTSPL